MIKILIADDEALVRNGLRWMLEATEGFEVVGEAADGGEAVEAALRLRPSVVLMDIRMGALDGIEATRRLLAAAGRDGPRVLMLTTFDFERNIYEALRAGASGFLLKDTAPDRLVEAVRTVAAGEALLAPGITRKLIEHYVNRPKAHLARRGELASLTEREIEMLELLARGLSNAELAARLHLSEATVKSHLSSMFGKLGLKSRIQAVVLAYESGLVEPGRAADDAGP
jgi:DNA-binding NarL/FixJ family response regulator